MAKTPKLSSEKTPQMVGADILYELFFAYIRYNLCTLRWVGDIYIYINYYPLRDCGYIYPNLLLLVVQFTHGANMSCGPWPGQPPKPPQHRLCCLLPRCLSDCRWPFQGAMLSKYEFSGGWNKNLWLFSCLATNWTQSQSWFQEHPFGCTNH